MEQDMECSIGTGLKVLRQSGTELAYRVGAVCDIVEDVGMGVEDRVDEANGLDGRLRD